MRAVRRTVGLILVAVLVVGVSACRHKPAGPKPRSPRSVATPQELEQLGTRHYTDRSRDDVVNAVVTALKVLGYSVITTDPRIRTAPRNVALTAVHGNYNSQGYMEAVAWDVDVRTDGPAVTLLATPRATVNGEPMTQVYIGWAEKTFAELMREIDTSLPSKTAPPAGTPAPSY